MSNHETCTTDQFLWLSEAEFRECLVLFFRPFVSTRPMDWECIQKSMTFFAPIFKFKELVDLYFDYIFGLFEDFRITDSEVAVSSVKKYCRFKLNYCGFPPADPGEFHHPVDARIDYGVPRYEYFLVPQYLEELPSRPFLYRDTKAVERILRYVAPVSIETKDLRNYANYVMFSIRIDPFVLDHVDYFHWTLRGEAVGGRRLKLILMATDFVLQVRLQNCKDALRGLKLLFQAIPDPQVTWFEILGFLGRRLTFSPSDSKDSYTKSFLETCKRWYPVCLQSLKPRSLKHLARCEVRSCLGRAHSLPHGVWSLQLPRELENYVLLQRRKDQFRPVIHPLSSEKVFALETVPEI